ncbi:hypothetical protein VDP44_21715, partial [Xanthomonas campestris pv. campestris]|nr:hypothetical protein [Xanthomonas campestris pv. campestris]MEB2060169.1 hypothetical protein [Xanthomonas campestris pv. campestris]
PKIQTRLSRAMRHPALSGLIVQTFPKSDIAPDIRTDDLYILKGGYLVISDGKSVSQYRRCQ